MSSSEPFDVNQTIIAWADAVIREFDRRAQMLNIHEGALLNSFVRHAHWASGGSIEKIEFLFNHYGKFVDMGVGKGVPLALRDALTAQGHTARRPKPWFTDTFYRKLRWLQHTLSERTARNTQLAIVRGLRDSDGEVVVRI